MKNYKSLYSIGLAVLVSLALSGQHVEGRDKKDDKKDGKSDDNRARSSAPARVSSSSNEKRHVDHSSSSRGPSSFAQRQEKSGGPSVHQRKSFAESSHQKSPKDFANRDSKSRSSIDHPRGYAAPRSLQDIVRDDKVAQSNRSDRNRDEKRISPRVIDRSSNRDRVVVQNDRNSRVDSNYRDNRSSQNFDSSSRRSHDWANHSTRYRSSGNHHRGVWRGDSTWCPDRSWAWHHHHRYFWNGIWVIGEYPSFGYYPSVYTYDPQPIYSADATGVAVQRALAEEGYYDGPIDGIVGDGTRGAIADYQYDNNLPVSGLIDDELLRSLGIV